MLQPLCSTARTTAVVLRNRGSLPSHLPAMTPSMPLCDGSDATQPGRCLTRAHDALPPAWTRARVLASPTGDCQLMVSFTSERNVLRGANATATDAAPGRGGMMEPWQSGF